MKIYVIDNGGQWTHKEWRTLRDLGVETKITTEIEPNLDGLILSGGPIRLSSDTLKFNCFNLDIPILGICAGHQHIAKYFGGSVIPSKTPEFGKAELVLNGHKDKILKNIPKNSVVWESHNDEVSILPKNFILLGSSQSCKIQLMKHNTKPIYGFQFHPEVEHTEYGEQFFKNFIEICDKQKTSL